MATFFSGQSFEVNSIESLLLLWFAFTVMWMVMFGMMSGSSSKYL